MFGGGAVRQERDEMIMVADHAIEDAASVSPYF
jgi:hypothetical protein